MLSDRHYCARGIAFLKTLVFRGWKQNRHCLFVETYHIKLKYLLSNLAHSRETFPAGATAWAHSVLNALLNATPGTCNAAALFLSRWASVWKPLTWISVALFYSCFTVGNKHWSHFTVNKLKNQGNNWKGFFLISSFLFSINIMPDNFLPLCCF